MSLTIEFIAPLIAVAGGLIGSFITSRFSHLMRKRHKEEEKHVEELYKKNIEQYLKKLNKSFPEIEVGDNWKELLEQYYTIAIPKVKKHDDSPEYEKEIQKRIDEKLHTLKDRIENIEQRFPSQDTVEKIASVNEAILATQIENLTEIIKGLEQRALSKWDVAKIVFQIIAALGGLIGVILGLLAYFTKASGG